MKRSRSAVAVLTVSVATQRFSFQIPTPKSISDFPFATLFLCESCLRYFSARRTLELHECAQWVNTDATTRYFDPTSGIRVVELDARKPSCNPICRRLCLMGKLLLPTKAPLDDCHFFNFFVLLEEDSQSGRRSILGYFSKDSNPASVVNLACLVVFPPHQGRGLGALLVSVSYALSRREMKLATPERPFSRQGFATYLSLWKFFVGEEIDKKKSGSVTIDSLCSSTGMTPNDVMQALEEMGVVHATNSGKHVVILWPSLRDDQSLQRFRSAFMV